MNKFFDFSDKELQETYTEEGFIADVQFEISRLLTEKGISRSEFARSMKVSPAYVSQMLGDEGANLTSRTIARAFIALGEEPAICCKRNLTRTANEYHSQLRTAGWLDVAATPRTDWRREPVEPSSRTGAAAAGSNSNVVWLKAYKKAA